MLEAPAKAIRKALRTCGTSPSGKRPSPAVLGLAFLVPVIWVCRRVSLPLMQALAAPTSPTTCIALVAGGFVAGAATLAGQSLASGSAGARPSPAVQGPLCCLTLIAASAFLVLPQPGEIAASVLSCCVCVLLGVCLCVQLVGWTCLYARLEGTAPLTCVALSILVGDVPRTVLQFMDGVLAQGVFLGCCLLASALCLARCEADGRAHSTAAGLAPEHVDGSGRAWHERRQIRHVLRDSLGTPALGLALCCYAWGVMAVPPEQYTLDRNALVFIFGNLLALVVVRAFVRGLPAGATHRDVRQRAFFLLPLFAVLMALFAFIRMLDAWGPLRALLSVGYNAAVAGLATMFLATTAMSCHERRLPAVTQVAGPFLLFAIVYLAGERAYAALGNTSMYLLVVLVLAYLLILSCIMTRGAVLRDDEVLNRRCAALARSRGLSERETEVLFLLASSYSTEGIAEHLGISPATVGTHRKHIYAKVGAHSRDDLMRALREEQP